MCQYTANTPQKNYNKTRLRNQGISPTLCKNAPTFSPELWYFSLQVFQMENPLNLKFQTRDKIVIYVSTYVHSNWTTLQQH